MAQDKRRVEILERGNIYFCYTHQVEHDREYRAETLKDLRMRKSRHPIETLFTGGWR